MEAYSLPTARRKVIGVIYSVEYGIVFIEIILVLSLIVKFFGINTDLHYVSFINTLSDALIDPFSFIFVSNSIFLEKLLRVKIIFAMILYWFVSQAIIEMLILYQVTYNRRDVNRERRKEYVDVNSE